MGTLIWIAALIYVATRATPENEPPHEGMDKPMTEAMGRQWRAVLFMGASIAYWLGSGMLR